MERGACASDDYTEERERWFPTSGQPGRFPKRICNTQCPVLAECAEYAVTFPVPLEGVWGGMTRRELRAARQARGVKLVTEAALSNLPESKDA